MKILEKLKRAADPNARAISSDLARLNDVRTGLGDDSIDYVLSGRNGVVLSSLSTLCTGKEIDVCQGYIRQESPTWARRKLFVLLDPYDVDLICRYVEVLSAACPMLPDYTAGSNKAPKSIRVFFSEAFGGMTKEQGRWPPNAVSITTKGLTLDVAQRVTAALGGTTADLVDLLFNEQNRWTSVSGALYRTVVDPKPLALKEPVAFLEGCARLYAPARAKLIQELNRFQLIGERPFLTFVVDQAGDNSKAVREMACSVLSGVAPQVLEPEAARRLKHGDVSMRAGMVELVSNIRSERAVEILREHRADEKTARINAAIDSALTARRHAETSAEPDSDSRYQAIDGSFVEVPLRQPFPREEAPHFGSDATARLVAIIDAENERLRKQGEENERQGYKWKPPLFERKLAASVVQLFNGDYAIDPGESQRLSHFLSMAGASWAREALAKLPRASALKLSAAVAGSARRALSAHVYGPFVGHLRNYLLGPDGDLRQLEQIDIDAGVENKFGWGAGSPKRRTERGDFLRSAIQQEYVYLDTHLAGVPPSAVWPYIAENLNVIDEAFGLAPPSIVKLGRTAAVLVLAHLPKAPARYFAPLLEAAISESKAGRAEARVMLQDAPGITARIVALLDDSRQAIRAGAAEWLARRNEVGSIPVLKKRLSREKSEVGRAAILSALKALGQDLEGFVGPSALRAEAEKGLKSARLDKLDWMHLDHLPSVRFRSRKPVPPDVIRWWLFVAFKLKQPGGNALFDIYMDRLDPPDAEKLSTWIFESWLAYDTARPSDTDANAFANQHAASRLKSFQRWMPEYTAERAFAELKREFLATYLNSGAATKGLLALCKKCTPAIAADRTRSYLKNHGSRTSQASALLEMLAAMDSPVALQVVIAAATRLKQKGVQQFANELVLRIADAREWTLDELADRTVPAAGLDDDGQLGLVCGDSEKPYRAILESNLTLTLVNADGKPIKGLPAGTDEATKASKKQLSASRKELKQVLTMQTARLYENLCAERKWPRGDWESDYLCHPIMRRLIERIVWLGLDKDGRIVQSFRPTPEGDFTDASDGPVDLNDVANVQIAHGSAVATEESKCWEQHFKDYEIEPLFTQFGRQLLRVESAAAKTLAIEDRKGWVTDTFTIRGAASKLGYERGEALDGGYFNEYLKSFKAAAIVAVVEFSGNCLPEQNVPAALVSLSFEKLQQGRRTRTALPLSDVPAVLLSECWNDYRTMAAKAAFDENWQKKMPWM